MEELIEIIEKKIEIYKSLFKISKSLSKDDDTEYYTKCLYKLRKCLEVLKS